LVIKRGDVLFFVMERNDDGILWHQPSIIDFGCSQS
jgi:hypothetical protein